MSRNHPATRTPSSNRRLPREIILHFVRDVGRSDLNKGWDEGFEKNAKGEFPMLEERIEAFKGLMAYMKTGQRLSFLHKPGEGIEVEVDGTVKGMIEGDDFARALFSVWLGSSPPNPELRPGCSAVSANEPAMAPKNPAKVLTGNWRLRR